MSGEHADEDELGSGNRRLHRIAEEVVQVELLQPRIRAHPGIQEEEGRVGLERTPQLLEVVGGRRPRAAPAMAADAGPAAFALARLVLGKGGGGIVERQVGERENCGSSATAASMPPLRTLAQRSRSRPSRSCSKNSGDGETTPSGPES